MTPAKCFLCGMVREESARDNVPAPETKALGPPLRAGRIDADHADGLDAAAVSTGLKKS
jgi:hypothetical protein